MFYLGTGFHGRRHRTADAYSADRGGCLPAVADWCQAQAQAQAPAPAPASQWQCALNGSFTLS